MTDFTNYILDNADNITFLLTFVSIVISVVVGIIYYYANMKKRELVSTMLSMFGNFILILNILFIIFDKFLGRLNQKINNIKDLNRLTLTSLNNIYTSFYKDPKNLGGLYSEIFENKVDSKPKLTYYENNFLFTLFQTIEAVYRMYYVSGKETMKLSKDQYEGWDNFLNSVCASPKVQLFYKKNHHLFTSLNFEKYMGKYFNNVHIYIDNFPKI
tara:strand:+ start:78 stop:719 length:642 start_codon:yes stop_codon:yes gene_type:complete